MSGGEVFLLIFLGLLVLVGVILAIYFVLRHDNKKNKPSNGGATGPAGPTGPNVTPLTPLIPGSTGPIKNQNFSLSVNQNTKFKASVGEVPFLDRRYASAYDIKLKINNPCDAYLWQYKDVTRNNTSIPNAIEFQHNVPGKGILYPTDETIAVKVGNNFQNAKRIKIDDNDITTSQAIDASWIFKDSKICLQNKPNMCLFVEDTEVTGVLATMFLADSTNVVDKGFSWVVGSPPTASDGCSV